MYAENRRKRLNSISTRPEGFNVRATVESRGKSGLGASRSKSKKDPNGTGRVSARSSTAARDDDPINPPSSLVNIEESDSDEDGRDGPKNAIPVAETKFYSSSKVGDMAKELNKRASIIGLTDAVANEAVAAEAAAVAAGSCSGSLVGDKPPTARGIGIVAGIPHPVITEKLQHAIETMALATSSAVSQVNDDPVRPDMFNQELSNDESSNKLLMNAVESDDEMYEVVDEVQDFTHSSNKQPVRSSKLACVTFRSKVVFDHTTACPLYGIP